MNFELTEEQKMMVDAVKRFVDKDSPITRFRQIRGTEDPDRREELASAGLELRPSADPATVSEGTQPTWVGITTSGTKVTGVFDGSPAHSAGISVGDELIAIERLPESDETGDRTPNWR